MKTKNAEAVEVKDAGVMEAKNTEKTEAKEEKGIVNYASIRYISGSDAVFERTDGGFLALSVGEDEKYPRVNLYRAFPFTHARMYISVRDIEGKEIAMIKDMDVFPQETSALLEEQLSRRYFAPIVRKINSIKDEFGYSYWDVLTDSGDCRFTIKGAQNVFQVDNARVLIVDVDGNRFEIPDISQLEEKSFRKLEMYL